MIKTDHMDAGPGFNRADNAEFPIRTAAGFTLVEVLAVTTVVSIIALVVNLNLAPAEPYKIELAATEMALTFRYARSEAMRTSSPHGVRILTGERLLLVIHDDFDIFHPISKQPYEVDLANLGGGTTLTSNQVWSGICDDPNFVSFDAAGRPRCQDPWGVLLNSSTVALSWSGHTRTVTIEGETGRVTIQ